MLRQIFGASPRHWSSWPRQSPTLKPQPKNSPISRAADSGEWLTVKMRYKDPDAETSRLLSKPRTPPLTQAQAECLGIVAYLQPVSRPEIARIRGVASESAVGSGFFLSARSRSFKAFSIAAAMLLAKEVGSTPPGTSLFPISRAGS